MDRFPCQPDEGYSEEPLDLLTPRSPNCDRIDEIGLFGNANPDADPLTPWLTQRIGQMSLSDRTELAMAFLDHLPTSVVSQIVRQLNPRLYIDFVRYLPAEVCLKILGYLDPLSLFNAGRSCRAWYELALDRKLWQQLYFLEGWKGNMDELAAWETRAHTEMVPQGVQRIQSDEDGHVHKRRALSTSPTLNGDGDRLATNESSELLDTERSAAGDSLFGGPCLSKTSSSSTGFRRLRTGDMGKGKARAESPVPEAPSPSAATRDTSRQSTFARQQLGTWDSSERRGKINWKYLYTMRRRLESNWELGKYINFQLPMPDYAYEGHRECVYSLQFNNDYLVSGSRDRSLKIWNMHTRRLVRTLTKHTGSVLCLQFDSSLEEDLVVSGSSDSNVILWKFSTGQEMQTLRRVHRESVLNVKFDKRILVTCSKDKLIKIFTRRPLNRGDLGYSAVDAVGRSIKDYAYNISPVLDDYPEIPAWTLIGTLTGHAAAVNAVQISGSTVVSASGDRHIKVWDWPTENLTRTIVGHAKGIACLQYDGRRIVSGSSDNEVRIFDAATGLEVASLRGHHDLVRTLQAGFGDLATSVEDDAAEAARVDRVFFEALEAGEIEAANGPRPCRRSGNAGSRRPQDITAYGAKLPPGGGGGRYGRIVSGSYDTSIIVWRRDKEGVWKPQHHLKHEDGARNAAAVSRRAPIRNQPMASNHSVPGPARSATAETSPRTMHSARAAPPAGGLLTAPDGLMLGSGQTFRSVIDTSVGGRPVSLSNGLAAYPQMLGERAHLTAAIDRTPNPMVRSQMRHVVNAALARSNLDMTRQRREADRIAESAAASSTDDTRAEASTQTAHWPRTQSSRASFAQAASSPSLPTPPTPATAPASDHSALTSSSFTAPVPPAHPSVPQAHQDARQPPLPPAGNLINLIPPVRPPPPAVLVPPTRDPPIIPSRVFKLQFDARRIMCCSVTTTIVGWDFCNDDVELQEVCAFFGTID